MSGIEVSTEIITKLRAINNGLRFLIHNHPLATKWHFLALGPMPATYKRGGPDASEQWTEIFSPDLDCTVRNVTVSGVRTRELQIDLPIEQVVKVIEQKLNPDYPKPTPKGGTGKGIWIR